MEGVSTEGLPFCGTIAQSLAWDYFEWMISLSQRLLPTKQIEETIIHAFGWIWIHDPRNKVAAVLHLRQHGHQDQPRGLPSLVFIEETW